MKFTIQCLVLAMGWMILPQTAFTASGKEASSSQVEEIHFVESTKEKSKPIKKDFFKDVSQVFSNDLSLSVPLDEVILLVFLVSVLALFKKSRIIMGTCYIFCLKWVFWINYSQLLNQSDNVTHAATWVFGLCGLIALVSFCIKE